MRSGKDGIEPHDPCRLRSEDLGERLAIRSEERAVEGFHKLAQPLLVHGELLYAVEVERAWSF